MRSAEPGRRALLEAGQRLLGADDLAKVSVNSIVAEAGMAKGAFYQHWRSRDDYIRALHRDFHDRLRERVRSATDAAPAGLGRIEAALNAYLDGCLAEPATKALLVQARTQANLSPEVAAQHEHFATMVVADVRELGWSEPAEVALLLVAIAAEIALQELTARRALPDLRRAALKMAGHSP